MKFDVMLTITRQVTVRVDAESKEQARREVYETIESDWNIVEENHDQTLIEFHGVNKVEETPSIGLAELMKQKLRESGSF